LVIVGNEAVIARGLSAGKGKYLGNIIGYGSARSDYLELWNGVTAENASKWGSIERTRDNMNWSGSDNIYNFAETNHLMYRYHAIAWGSQYPSWIEALSSDVTAFRAEVEEYMAVMPGDIPTSIRLMC
jgi:GH35 family endo-1,4-beta-xylanase